MGYTVIAPVGDNLKAIFIGMKEFPTEKVYLISPTENMNDAIDLSNKLKEFTIKTEIMEIKRNLMEGMFESFGKICSIYENENIIVNVATGDRISTCAALSASYANGLKTFGVMGDKTMLLPIMKLSYYNELSDNKMKILKKLCTDKFIALKDLAKETNMSISLVSYHINGNYKYKGLKELRLVEIDEANQIKISELGNLLLKGYIKTEKNPYC